MPHCVRRLCTSALAILISGCDVADHVRGGSEAADSALSASAGGVALGLQAPGELRPGEEGVVRVSLTSRGETVPANLRLEVIIPAWMEAAPPRPGEPEVTMATSGEGIRLSYRVEHTQLDAGQARTIEQRIRVPIDSPVGRGMTAWSPVVRARLIGPNDEPLAEVQSEIALRGAIPGDSTSPRQGSAPPTARDQLGPVRLGMASALVRRAAPTARDTAWTQEGMRARGLVVPMEGGGRSHVFLSGDSVVRIEVRDSVPRTRERVGVGTTLEQLQRAYGRPCASIGEGDVVVWFPNAPGLSFALDAPIPRPGGSGAVDPDRLPASARVTRWWLRRGTDRCS